MFNRRLFCHGELQTVLADYQYKHSAVDWDTHASNKTQVQDVDVCAGFVKAIEHGLVHEKSAVERLQNKRVGVAQQGQVIFQDVAVV